MFLSMQTAFAACKQSFAAQQKKVATISKKKVAGGKKKIYRKASMRKYSQKKQLIKQLNNKVDDYLYSKQENIHIIYDTY